MKYNEKGWTRWDRFLNWIGFHIHERRLFCLGKIAVVKCVTCGDESMPWEVGKENAEEWHKLHPKGEAEYCEISKRLKESRA